MAHHNSAKKRIRSNEKRRVENRYYAKTMRNALRDFRALTDKAAATERLPKMVSIIEEAPHGGKFCLRILDESPTEGSSCRSTAMPVTVGKTYAVRFWARNNARRGAVGVYGEGGYRGFGHANKRIFLKFVKAVSGDQDVGFALGVGTGITHIARSVKFADIPEFGAGAGAKAGEKKE